MNRWRSMTNLSCVASPIFPFSSSATILNVSFLPSAAVRVAVAFTRHPSVVGRMCVAFIMLPTVLSLSASCCAAAFIAAFSMSAIMAGVASTGRSPLPAFSARCCCPTVISDVNVSPVSMFLFALVWFCVSFPALSDARPCRLCCRSCVSRTAGRTLGKPSRGMLRRSLP